MSGLIKTEFLIHDNRGRPFKIVLHPHGEKLLDVFIGKYLEQDWDYSNHLKTFEYEEIFIGQGTYDSTEYCDYSYGNAVLILLKSVPPLQYVYIGQRIVQFTAEVHIEKFVSTIGNQDVPYSYARDKDGGHYFFQVGFYSALGHLAHFVRSSDMPDDISNGKPLAIYRYYYDHCAGKQAMAVEGILHHDRNFG